MWRHGRGEHGGGEARWCKRRLSARPLIVAGPTCSGKSALALDLARAVRRHGHQRRFHAGLSRAARRSPRGRRPAEEARAPHAPVRRPPGRRSRAASAWWRGAALAAMEAARAAGRLPILCGGTGLYFASLTAGPRPIPDPGPAAREAARALLAEIGPGGAACPARGGRSGDGGAPAADRQPAHRAGVGGLARDRQVASRPGRRGTVEPAPWRFARHPARSAARGAARGDRRAVRGHAARGRAGGSAGAAGAGARSRACRPCGRMACRSFPPICAGR